MGFATAQDEAAKPAPKHTIKEVMVNAHKDGLLKKILAGEASAEEKMVLLDHYISMVECAPPKGELASWQTLSGKAALAAAKVAVGREGSLDELKAATNCAACHKAHKGD
jgi:hypothetical protein